MGFALAFGGLPLPFLSGHLGSILDHLIACATSVEGYEPRFAEARRDAVNAITRCVCVCVCVCVWVGGCGCARVWVGVWVCFMSACHVHNKSVNPNPNTNACVTLTAFVPQLIFLSLGHVMTS